MSMIKHISQRLCLTLILLLVFSTFASAFSIRQSVWPEVWEECNLEMIVGQVGPCADGLVATWADTFTSDGTKLLDKSTSATHEATKAISLEFSGAQYGTLATAVTLVGDFDIGGSIVSTDFSGRNTLLSGSTTTEGLVQIDVDGGIRLWIDGVSYDFDNYPISVDTIAVWTIVRVGSNITVTVNDDGETQSCSAATMIFREVGSFASGAPFFIGNAWNFYTKNSTGTTVWQNYLSNGSGTTATSVVGPDVSLVGFTMDDDWTESSLYGSIEHNALGWSDGASIPESVAGIIPASLTTPTQDVYGNALTYPGKGQQNLLVEGYTIGWDGTAYATLGSAVTSNGDFKWVIKGKLSSTPGLYVFIGDGGIGNNFVYVDSSGNINIRIGGTAYMSSAIATFGVDYTLTLERVNTTLTYTFNSSSDTDTVNTNDFVITEITRSTTFKMQGTMSSIERYTASGVLVNHWPIEGRNEASDTQITIYDVVSGNDATVVSGTTPLFTEAFSPSYLAANGFQVSGINTIPYPVGTKQYTGIHDAPADIFNVNFPETLEMYEAVPARFDGSGVPLDIDPADLVRLDDQEFYNDTDALIYSKEITGDCLIKTEKYMGFPYGELYIIDRNGNYLIDDNGNYIIK